MPQFLILGQIGRDFRMVGLSDDEGEANLLAERSVLEARMASALVIPVSSYFTEANVRFRSPDLPRNELVSTPGPTALQLNPGAGEQPITDFSSDQPEVDHFVERTKSTFATGGEPQPIGTAEGSAPPEGPGSLHPSVGTQGSAAPDVDPPEVIPIGEISDAGAGPGVQAAAGAPDDQVHQAINQSEPAQAPSDQTGPINQPAPIDNLTPTPDTPAETTPDNTPSANGQPVGGIEGNTPAPSNPPNNPAASPFRTGGPAPTA